MSRVDLTNDLNAVRSLAVAARTNGAVNGAGVDLANYDGAMVVVLTGTMTDGSFAITLEESDDNSTFTAVAAADRIGNLPTLASTDDDTTFEFGYKGIKRYIRVVETGSGTTTGGVFGAMVVRGKPRVKPA